MTRKAKNSKKAPTKKRSKKKSKARPKRSTRRRILRGWILLLSLVFLFCAAGAVGLRIMVLQKTSSRISASSASVQSRVFRFRQGSNITNSRVSSRLSRLAYTRVKQTPSRPGQYRRTNKSLDIYVREFQLPNGALQPAQRINLKLNSQGRISSLSFDGQQSGREALLEPESFSQTNASNQRASNYKRLEEFPEALPKAILAIEDERFYRHFGVDLRAIARAVFANVSSGGIVQGASTINQQLIKNLFLSPKRTISRKLIEAVGAVLLDLGMTKDEILELYLNEVFLAQEGNTAVHGFSEASQSFFRKPIEEASLAEVATLAGMVKAPTTYSPRRSAERAKKRRQVVLSKMKELSYIDEPQYSKASRAKLQIFNKRNSTKVAPFFAQTVKNVAANLNLEGENLKLHTDLDMEYQLCAERSLAKGLQEIEAKFPKLKKRKDPLQASLLSVDIRDNSVRAWVGGRDFGLNQFDRVIQSKRQPGSAFKPFVYLTALDPSLNNYRVARTTSLLDDSKVTLDLANGKTWTPKNYDGKFRGSVTVREALAKSLNIPTINMAQKVGIDLVARTAELFGFGRNLPRVPSLALGAGEVSVLDLTKAYGGIASGGYLQNISPLKSATRSDKQGFVAPRRPSREAVASEGSTFVLTNILQSAIEQGTGRVVRRMGFKGPVAGKTGTTNDTRDAWFAGFTPNLLTVVWVGFDDNSKTGVTGSSGAAPIWTHYNKCVQEMEPQLEFTKPDSAIFRRIDRTTGMLATSSCPLEDRVLEVFVDGYHPITPCERHAPDLSDRMPAIRPGTYDWGDERGLADSPRSDYEQPGYSRRDNRGRREREQRKSYPARILESLGF